MEIVVFENNILYDSAKVSDDAVDVFISMCKRYVSPEGIPKESTYLHNGHTFVTYSDTSGCYKPCMVMIFGITSDIFLKIKQALEDMYEEYHWR